MSNNTFLSITSICLILSILSLYYIFMNTALAENVYSKVEVNGIEYSIDNDTDLHTRLNEIVNDNLPKTFKFKTQDETFTILTQELNITADTKSLIQFGKGSDPNKVFLEGIRILQGEAIDLEFYLDPAPILNRLPYSYSTEGYIQMEEGRIYNCKDRKVNAQFNIPKIKDMIETALKNNELLVINMEDIIEDEDLLELITYCSRYIKTINTLDEAIDLNINLHDHLLPDTKGSEMEVIISDEYGLKQELSNLSYINYKAPFDGEYFEKEGKLYFTMMYEYGNKLDIDKSIENIKGYLESGYLGEEIIAYEPITPPILNEDKDMINMSQRMGVGYTRLDLYRDGAFNYRVPNSQAPLWALNNLILEPGREFSFHNDSGIATNSVRSGIGVCNSTTTLFRAALDAGLEITDRSAHTSYVTSYEYGPYPLNIVEATYNPYPFVDLKFKNDLKHPIVLKIIIDRRTDGYQYHTVEIYTSPDEPTRDVELTDWKKWSVIDNTHFRGSFKRIVRVNGAIIKEEKYNSNYTY